jgi:hypothetical protein
VRAEAHALLESRELILRGGVRRSVPVAEMAQVRAEGNSLHFTIRGEAVALELGEALAKQWATKITSPPPSLAKKLGIGPDATVRLIGPLDDRELETALDQARAVSPKDGDLIVARVDTPLDLYAALKKCADQLDRRVPIWFVYRKGKGHSLDEHAIRGAALDAGLVDNKISAVSGAFTAMRCVKRRKP